MPRLSRPVALALVALTAQGCASHDTAKPASQHVAPTSTTGLPDTKTYTMQSAGKDVLRIAAPAEAACTLTDGSIDVKSREGYVNIWIVRGAKSVTEGVQRMPTEIVSEFKDFKPDRTTTMTLASAPGNGGSASAVATRLVGTG